jgi:hypothetical protein
VGQAQDPAEHVAPVAHATPHPPQLFVSVWSLMHAPLQTI